MDALFQGTKVTVRNLLSLIKGACGHARESPIANRVRGVACAGDTSFSPPCLFSKQPYLFRCTSLQSAGRIKIASRKAFEQRSASERAKERSKENIINLNKLINLIYLINIYNIYIYNT